MRFLPTTFFSLAAAVAAYDYAGLEVKAPAGVIKGSFVGNSTNVRQFLGIPYAQSTAGENRFLPPKPLKKFTTPFTANAFGASCYSSAFLANLGDSPISLPPPSRESEDCLNINVWTPSKGRVPKGGAAVLLWVYGGGFVLGTSETPIYNGANLVRDQEGVIVVSFNYRLTSFGFPGAPGLPETEKNPGLRDVRAAVEWVRDNIAAFGGDPKRITLFGESAGGAAVDAYTYFAAKDPIIHAAILQSGTISISTDNLLGGATSATQRWSKLSEIAGCPVEDNSENLKCMQAIPAEAFRNYTNAAGVSFGPSPDDGTVPKNAAARLAAGEVAKIPMLIGSNDQELPGNSTQAVMGTLLAFTCPAARRIAGHVKAGYPGWQYRWYGDFPTTAGGPTAGPFHGSEVPQVFGTYYPVGAPAAQVDSSKYIQKAWAEFAKNPKTALTELGWPQFKPGEASVVRLTYQNVPGATFTTPASVQGMCPA